VTGLSLPQNGGSCTLIVDYMPVSPVVSTATIDVQYSGSNLEAAVATRIIKGTGSLDCFDYPVPACPPPLPALAFTDSVSPNYGNVNIGSSADATFVLVNEGPVDGTLGTVSDSGVGISAPFSVQGGTCVTGFVLQARKANSCTLIVRFTPQTPGTVAAQTVSVSYAGTNGSSVVTRSVYGTGVLNCQADGNLLSYFNQGETAAGNDNSSAAAQGTAAGNAASYQTGYNDGYAATYTAVYNSAYQKAYTAAYNAAYPTAYGNAYNQTCPGGTSAGTTDGKSEGTTTGQHDGYQAGYNAAYPTAYTDGYNQGFAAGQQACSQATAAVQLDEQIRALVAARQGGTTSGAPTVRTQTTPPDQNPSNEQACYNQGYNQTYNPNAYQQAYATAVKTNPNYQQGYSAGTNQASTDAQAAGAAKGTPDGTAAAQNDGATNGSADGYNKCYQAAYTSAYNSAYTTAYNAAYPNGSNAGDADGTSVGYTDGYNAAANCGNTAAAVQVVAKVSRGLAPNTRFMPSYGSGQSWAVAGPNGLVLDVFVQEPVMRGAPVAALNRDLRNQSLELMQSSAAPALRLQLLLQRRAAQANLR
jgi:flagellar biosynthesis/type III secretory pathway protein FliH